ncbi:hypothetical protein ACIBIZ_08935 [Nonomuraea spiralis]|nr:hypothetical protein [Nonomuraea sp. WAC 01424]
MPAFWPGIVSFRDSDSLHEDLFGGAIDLGAVARGEPTGRTRLGRRPR